MMGYEIRYRAGSPFIFAADTTRVACVVDEAAARKMLAYCNVHDELVKLRDELAHACRLLLLVNHCTDDPDGKAEVEKCRKIARTALAKVKP